MKAGCENTVFKEVIEVTEKAAETGAHAAMIVTPHYYKPRMDYVALCAHYTFLADRSPIPIILYNVPGFTGVDLEARTIIELAVRKFLAAGAKRRRDLRDIEILNRQMP
ncbi:MAG: dihydrodipicolinate synthase family protein [Deltaproteobacteria bacterium]|nr:dihydrodipicolinate synthase family protein [Deltaproteobacteria bacterium]